MSKRTLLLSLLGIVLILRHIDRFDRFSNGLFIVA